MAVPTGIFLRRAVLEIDHLLVFDNTSADASHELVLEAHSGEIQYLAPTIPHWLRLALDVD